KAAKPSEIALSSITQMEILYGFALNDSARRRFEQSFTNICAVATVISFDQHCAETAAQIRVQLKLSGKQIGPWNLLIGATAVAHRCTLVTSNLSEFERLPEMQLENWR
ncbi:MAG TPA: PIN domain-containing protein, partial [Trichormus sp.]